MKDVIKFLEQMDKHWMALDVRWLVEVNLQLYRDLKYEKQRREIAERAFLEEADKNWLQRLWSL